MYSVIADAGKLASIWPAASRKSRVPPRMAARMRQGSRVLIVANRTASTPRLIDAVRRRAEAGPCEFALLIPDVTDRKAADWTLETALRLLKPAARGKSKDWSAAPTRSSRSERQWSRGTST